MTIAVTMGFNYTVPAKLTGFSETHYLLNTADADNADAKNAAIALANLRVLLLGKGCALVFVRLSDTAVDRDSVQLSVGDVLNPGSIAPIPDDITLAAYGQCDLSNTAVQVRLGQSSKKWGNIYLAGVPDKLINTAVRSVDTAAVPLWATNFNNWKNKITNVGGGNWGFRARNQNGEGDVGPLAVIQDYVPEAMAGSRMGIVMLTAQANWNKGQVVHIYKPTLINRGYKTPAGNWVVNSKSTDAVAGTSTYFLKNSEGINISNILVNGFAQLVQQGYAGYQQGQIMGYATRKRGVGSFKQRGKSRRTVQRV